ncbi:hypothetical protein BKA69DRAFT_1079622 [Paraphysoderma sedebokerense]|nr:hypothetical protein BKA69DRAFT_1079622 [Paraphysoderma sedebokerense]
MDTSSSPLYSREQLKIPPLLPDILKNYSKHIIKTQPKDIFAASAEYFNNLYKISKGNEKAAEAAVKGSISSMVTIGVQHLETLYAKMTNRGSQKLSVDTIRQFCVESQIPKDRIDDILMIGKWGSNETISWLEFWSLACAASAGTLQSTLNLISSIRQLNQSVDTKEICAATRYLGGQDPDVGKAKAETVAQEIEAVGETITIDTLQAILSKHFGL